MDKELRKEWTLNPTKSEIERLWDMLLEILTMLRALTGEVNTANPHYKQCVILEERVRNHIREVAKG